ncbi:coiled-coil domain-containing protein 137 isoform X2 [Eublepharis macularius]|uniref:Coiled-coil domain-containing protein 137 isoform X2 n=1 Tax=Eublepharis macularius TaxID=481883 RepID=A0AA97KW44_EUBMA|nr:coiled-coil domain-containing protein 137 isoform X2 [Eublepharis macularius]
MGKQRQKTRAAAASAVSSSSRRGMTPRDGKRKRRSEGKIPVPRFRRQKGESESSYMKRMNQETQHVLFLTQNQPQQEPEKEEPIQEKSQKKKQFQQKKLDKIRKQKEEKKIAVLEKDLLRDSVQFGEVALAPPSLTAKPRKSVAKEKAGKRQLLLMSLLGSGAAASTHKVAPASLARQRIIREERDRVVQAYRDLKKRKQQQQLSAQSQLGMEKLRKPV